MNRQNNTIYNCIRLLICCLLVSLSLQSLAKAEDSLPSEVSDRVLALQYTHGLSADQTKSLLSAFELARSKGMPLEPLLRKVEEGLAKKVAVRRITQVLQNKVASLDQFKARLRAYNLSPDQELFYAQRLNEVIALGVTKQEIESYLGRKYSLSQTLNALETKAALVRSGLSLDQAEQVISSGLENSYFQNPAWNMVRFVRAGKRQNIALSRITKLSIEVVKGKKELRDACREVGIGYGNGIGKGSRSGSRQSGRGSSGGRGGGSSNGGGNGHGGGKNK